MKNKYLGAITGVVILVTQGILLISLKLCDIIGWSWWWIITPYYGLVVILLIVVLIRIFDRKNKKIRS